MLLLALDTSLAVGKAKPSIEDIGLGPGTLLHKLCIYFFHIGCRHKLPKD
jgi:hypothetical protein